jgi:hypothetical protein
VIQHDDTLRLIGLWPVRPGLARASGFVSLSGRAELRQFVAAMDTFVETFRMRRSLIDGPGQEKDLA